MYEINVDSPFTSIFIIHFLIFPSVYYGKFLAVGNIKSEFLIASFGQNKNSIFTFN